MIERRAPPGLGLGERHWGIRTAGAAHAPGARGAHPDRGVLRAWKQASIPPGASVPPQLHTDVEIVTCVREGVLMHEDDLGNHGASRAGDVHVMTAGSGMAYAAFNAGRDPARILQVWLRPDRRGYPPSWGRKAFPRVACKGRFITLASGLADDEGALPIRSDARVLAVALAAGQHAGYRFAPGARRGWVFAAQGALMVNGLPLGPGEAAAIVDEIQVVVMALEGAEGMLIDTRA